MANGLLDMFMPSEDEAMKRALMAAGFGMMGTRRGNEAQGLGRAGLLGMGVYENSLQNQLKNKTGQFDLASGIAKMQGEQQAAKQQQEAFAALAGMQGSPSSIAGPPAAFQTPGGVSSLMGGAASGMPAPATQLATQMAAPPDDPSAQKMAQANYLEDMFRKTGNPTMFLMAQKLREEAMKMRDENQGFETVIGPDGTPKIVQRRKFGAPQEMPYAPKPDMQILNLGDKQQAIDKLRVQPGQMWQQGQTPESKASNALGWANFGLAKNADARAAMAARDGVGSGGKWTNDLDRGIQINTGTGESRPITADGMPIGNKAETKSRQSADKVLEIVKEAEKYLDSATGSYGGAAVDIGARVFGASTKGATAIAQLQALEGALMLNQPRMEGPQSDKDTMIYRQMAGKIGDDTVPNSQKKAALQVIKQLQKRYASQNTAPATAPSVIDFSALPK